MKRRQQTATRGRPKKLPKQEVKKAPKQEIKKAPKTLCPNAVTAFLKFSQLDYFKISDVADFDKADAENFPLRYFLVSKKFHERCRQMEELALNLRVYVKADKPVDPDGSDNSDDLDNFDDPEGFDFSDLFRFKAGKKKENLDDLLTIIRFVEYPSIVIQFSNRYWLHEKMDEQLIKEFEEFCQGLEDIPSLQKIHANFINVHYKLKKATISSFVSLLPSNKRLSVTSSSDISSLEKQEPFERVQLYDLKFHKFTPEILKTKTKELLFTTENYPSMHIVKLHHLGKMGPFSPNHHLQKLKIPIDLNKSNFGSKPGYESEVKSIHSFEWDKTFLPLCHKAFEYLKNVNPNLEIQFLSYRGEKEIFESATSAFWHYENQVERAKSIIHAAKEFGFKIEVFPISMRFEFPYHLETAVVLNEFAEKAGIFVPGPEKQGDQLLRHSIEYNGVQIKFRITFLQGRRWPAAMRANMHRPGLKSDSSEEDE